MSEKKTEKYLDKDHCPIRCIISRIGDKWSVLIICLLGKSGTMRFNEISKTLGDISQKMLTTTLRSLESDGLISRQIYPEVPPRVEYKLTEFGKDLLPHLVNLTVWATKNMDRVMANRDAYRLSSK